MPYQNVWGGRGRPKLEVGASTWSFPKSVSSIRCHYEFAPVKKRVVEVESGALRHRVRGYRLRVTIEFGQPLNASFIEFMRNFLSCRQGKFYPRPYGIAHADNLAQYWWYVIPESDFDYRYFEEKAIGHGGTIVLLGLFMDAELPEDVTGAIYTTE